MEQDDQRVLWLAKPSAEDILTDLSEEQLEGIHSRLRTGIEELGAGHFAEYRGHAGLRTLADEVKARGRKALARKPAVSAVSRRKKRRS